MRPTPRCSTRSHDAGTARACANISARARSRSWRRSRRGETGEAARRATRAGHSRNDGIEAVRCGRPGSAACGRMLWVDPASIGGGRLTQLALPSRRAIRPRGVLLFSYARLELRLAIEGFDARFFAYDWRLGIDVIGAALAAAIAAAGKPAVLIAHSMGALVARVAIKRLPKRSVSRLIMLGAPNGARSLRCWRCAALTRSCRNWRGSTSSIRPTISPPRCSQASPAFITCCRRGGTSRPSICWIPRMAERWGRGPTRSCSRASRKRAREWRRPTSAWCRSSASTARQW